ncbi:MAG: nuclear transport factor 2 family protein [Microthrixaceae bacterium]
MTDLAHEMMDGQIHNAERVADLIAIQSLATAYAHAIDDLDWPRWTSLFLPYAHIDYTSAGGIEGTPAELAEWMPSALSIFDFCMHTTSTHEICLTSSDTATGRVHVFNRNGVHWEGRPEILDVGAVYHDSYRRVGATWRFSARVEHTTYITGGAFADMIREAAIASTPDGRRPPFG